MPERPAPGGDGALMNLKIALMTLILIFLQGLLQVIKVPMPAPYNGRYGIRCYELKL
jgi:hypothetical protein